MCYGRKLRIFDLLNNYGTKNLNILSLFYRKCKTNKIENIFKMNLEINKNNYILIEFYYFTKVNPQAVAYGPAGVGRVR